MQESLESLRITKGNSVPGIRLSRVIKLAVEPTIITREWDSNPQAILGESILFVKNSYGPNYKIFGTNDENWF